jgi:hypothetical protein
MALPDSRERGQTLAAGKVGKFFPQEMKRVPLFRVEKNIRK